MNGRIRYLSQPSRLTPSLLLCPPCAPQALLQAHQRFPHLAELEVDGLSSNCIRMLKALLTGRTLGFNLTDTAMLVSLTMHVKKRS